MNRAIVTVGGLGLLKPAPGTWASAAAVPLAWLLHGLTGFPGLFLATCAVIFAGHRAIVHYTAETGRKDPSEVVIDEVAGQWIALWPLSAGLWFAGAAPWLWPWPGWVGAFVLFRLFDIWKPGPVGRADRRGDAWGVMLDDLVAGALAALAVAVLAALAHLVVLG